MKFLVLASILILSLLGVQESFAQPAQNLKVVDLEGNHLDSVHSGQQVMLSHKVSTYHFPLVYDSNCLAMNMSVICSPEITTPYTIGEQIFQGHTNDMPFVIIFQIQDSEGVTIYLSWVEGRIHPDQVKTIESAWTSQEKGVYTASAFVWSAIDNPTALSPPISTTIQVTS